MDGLSLAAEFPRPSREAWLQLVERVLKGADFEQELVSRTYDGIRIDPLYPKAEAPAAEPGRGGRWRIAQRIDHPDPAAANELALADLEGGADGLTLVLARAPASRGFGLEIGTLDDLDRALAGVRLDLVHLRLDAGSQGRQAAAMLIALAERRGQDLARLDLDLALDPIGAMAATGQLSAPWETVAARCAETLSGLSQRGLTGKAFLADGRPYHDAGAGEAQELAAVTATGLAYLRALEAGGHALETASGALAFLLAADADEFLTIAKFRALRRLWARVEEACGLAPRPIRLHAETAWRMTSRRDPWVNMLRATVAAFSAGVGGADSITVLPFTAALGLPDAFARRMARNTQLILLDESNLWRVADAAAGSGAFEALTGALCETAWQLCQEIEREGGIVDSLKAGRLQGRIADLSARRERNIATRRDPITGTSEFPDLREAPVAVLRPFPEPSTTSEPQPRAEAASGLRASSAESSSKAESLVLPFDGLVAGIISGASLADLAAAPAGGPVAVTPLPAHRSAEPFERFREVSDSIHAAVRMRPRVFLANLGPVAAFAARAAFAVNFFEAGGFETFGNDDEATTAELVEAGLQWLAPLDNANRIVCLCSSDEVYEREAAVIANAFREAGVRRISLAGNPGSLKVDLRAAGIDMFIFAGSDALTVYARLYAAEA